jgi:hypothetical protein
MQHFNTLNDLILFACNENDLPDADRYHQIISSNKLLNREYKTIIRVRNYLSRIQIGPSESVIKNIMGFSMALSVSKTKFAGNFDLLLN